MTSPVFITGGAGFIGAHLAHSLVKNGAEVTVFDNFHPQLSGINRANGAQLAALGARVIEGDVCNPDALRQAINQTTPETIYHFAAETGTGQSYDMPARYADVNVMGTAHLIEAVREAPRPASRLILAGTRAVYGEGACVYQDGTAARAVARSVDDLKAGDFAPKDAQGTTLIPVATDHRCPEAPQSIYASTKLMQEHLLMQAFAGSETQVGILRLQNVYGPGQALNNPYTGVLAIFASQIRDGKTLNIFEDGQITRDFVFIDDVVAAFERMRTIPRMPTEIIDIGSGTPSTILDTARQILRLMSCDDDRLKITGAFRPGDVRHALADVSAARSVLDWEPQHGLATGLEKLIRWCERQLQDIA